MMTGASAKQPSPDPPNGNRPKFFQLLEPQLRRDSSNPGRIEELYYNGGSYRAVHSPEEQARYIWWLG
jgi:hypothetical protein